MSLSALPQAPTSLSWPFHLEQNLSPSRVPATLQAPPQQASQLPTWNPSLLKGGATQVITQPITTQVKMYYTVKEVIHTIEA